MVNADQYRVQAKPFYAPQGSEVDWYEAAYERRLPVMVKGPTGCGKSRFVEYMAWKLDKPLITVACNEDMTASDLTGRYLLDATGTRWVDGPLTTAARLGAICYLDEIVEARQDTTVVIHPLTDHRRALPLDKKGEVVQAHPDFQLVISYNPGYQSLMKDLKQSTKQRFVGMDFDYAGADLEASILVAETGIDAATASKLVTVGEAARNLKGHGLDEGISTRLMVYAANLIESGLPATDACRLAMVRPITDDADIRSTLDHAIDAVFGMGSESSARVATLALDSDPSTV
jgi:nitric oxide reductase NorQ protein